MVSVSNDLVTDQRVAKVCTTLTDMGYDVCLMGRKLPHSLPITQKPYKQIRLKLLFRKGPLFYACLNIRLFFKLLFSPSDILHANDLDTLLANFLVSIIKRKPIVYDSHEYFTGVPELIHNHFARRTWEQIERWIVPKLKYCLTVNDSIANLYANQYHIHFHVLRNVPQKWAKISDCKRAELGLPANRFLILLQGNGINIHRGSEELIQAMQQLDERFLLLIIGNGDVIPYLKKEVEEKQLQNKVQFIGRMPYEQLKAYTICCDLGVTLDKDNNLNYRYSLPNKIFDYLQAGLPVLSSPLPELTNIIQTYKVGWITENVTPGSIAKKIIYIFENPDEYQTCRENATIASEILIWEKEKKTLESLYMQIEKEKPTFVANKK